MNRPAVLVVDDKENMLKLFAKILGEEHNLTTASDGAKALALIAEHEFDVGGDRSQDAGGQWIHRVGIGQGALARDGGGPDDRLWLGFRRG